MSNCPKCNVTFRDTETACCYCGEQLDSLCPSDATACSAGPVTLRNVLIVMAADMLMTGEMPPEDASDWGFSKSTTLRDKVRVIGYARRSREQCRKWGVRLSEIAKSLPNDQGHAAARGGLD